MSSSVAPPTEKLVRFSVVCKRLGFHINTGYGWLRRGEFPIRTIEIGGRYYCWQDEVDAFFANRGGPA